MAEFMLTTVDNPFDPFTQFDEWMSYDETLGYYSMNYLARVADFSEDISPADQDVAIQTAIDEIVRENPLGIYRKVAKTG